MNCTFTPTLPPGVLRQARGLRRTLPSPTSPCARQADWSLVYLRGLLQDGERKSIEPLVGPRRPAAAPLRVKNPDQCLQNFVNQADWDEQAVWRRYRCVMAEAFADPEAVFVIDDTTFPKQGKHSVGVQRQHCGALGKKANCQAAVSVHYAAPRGHCPLAMRLYLPESWVGDADRLDKAGVPGPSREMKTKGQIALELLDQVRAEGLAGRVVVADSGYGVSKPFRDGLAGRGLHYVVGVTEEMVVFTEEPRWVAPQPSRGGRPRTRHCLAEDSPRPASLKDLASTAAAPGDHLASRDQGGPDGQVLLDSRLAGAGLGHRRLRRGRADLAADRGASRRADQICLLEPAGGDVEGAGRAPVAEPVAGGAGISANEGRTRPGSLRGPVVAWFPSPRLPGDAGIRVPGVGTTADRAHPGHVREKRGDRTGDHGAGSWPGLTRVAGAALSSRLPSLSARRIAAPVGSRAGRKSLFACSYGVVLEAIR